VGPFERIGVVSEVVKTEGEDLDTLGSFSRDRARWHDGDAVHEYVLLGPYLRELRDCNNSPISINKTKQHTYMYTYMCMYIYMCICIYICICVCIASDRILCAATLIGEIIVFKFD